MTHSLANDGRRRFTTTRALLVVEARSVDSKSLHVRVEPMDAPLERVEFTFRQLVPNAEYEVDVNGIVGHMTAEANGSGSFETPCSGPLLLTFVQRWRLPGRRFNCNDRWTRLVHVMYRIRRRPVLTRKAPKA